MSGSAGPPPWPLGNLGEPPRGRPPSPRFRTFQVCPKDLRAALRQIGAAEVMAAGNTGVRALGINVATSESAHLTNSPPRRFAMAFASYLGDFDFDVETNRVLDVALEMTRAALGLADDFANGIIARRILELARAGERNPDLLCEGALKKLRGALFGD